MRGVKRLRKRRGWTIQELADASGTSHFTVSEIELGKRNPHGKTLQKIASALDVEVSDLFDDEASTPKEEAPPEDVPAAAGALNEAPGRLELLEAHTTGIMNMVGELDPENEPLDRIAMRFLEAKLADIAQAITEKETQREKRSERANNPLADHLQETLKNVAGEKAEIYGVVGEGVVKTEAGSDQTEEERDASGERLTH